MKGKPIQAGCLALVVGVRQAKENNGRVVRVLRRVPVGEDPTPVQAYAEAARKRLTLTQHPEYEPDAARWYVEGINGPLSWVSGHARVVVRVPVRSYKEKYLVRIDDDSQDEPKTLKAPRPKDEVI